MNIKNFYSVFLFFIIFSAQALEYRWLERLKSGTSFNYRNHTDRQLDWLMEQDSRRDNYVDSLAESVIELDIVSYWSTEKTLQELTAVNGKRIKLLITENALSHKVVFENSERDKIVIIDTQDEDKLRESSIDSPVGIYKIKLDPSKRYLLVAVTINFTTIVRDILIYDLENLDEEPHKLPKARFEDITWYGERNLYYVQSRGRFNQQIKYNLDSKTHEITPESRFMYQQIKGSKYVYRLKKEGGEVYILVRDYARSVLDKKHIANADRIFNGKMKIKSLGSNDEVFVFTTNKKNYPELVIVKYERESESKVSIGELVKIEVPENGSFQNVYVTKDYIFAQYLSGENQRYYIFNNKGEEVHNLLASKSALTSVVQRNNNEFEFKSEIHHEKVFTITTRDLGNWNPRGIDSAMYTDAEGVRYSVRFVNSISKDGTTVPTRIVHRSDQRPTGNSPLYISAYGGHGSVTRFLPKYKIGIHSFIKNGGVYATPAVRGGGEFGHEWYTQVFGSLVRYEDTEAAVKGLHGQSIGSPSTTAFEGWSNGGLLAGVMLTRNPELFKLVIPGNGLHDMERLQVLQNGFFWESEFGDHNSQESVEYIRSYSPFYNAQKQQEYPTVYVMVGETDVRVSPSHSYKLVAALQDNQTSGNPIILDRYETLGHWPASPKNVLQEGIISLKRKWRVISNETGLN